MTVSLLTQGDETAHFQLSVVLPSQREKSLETTHVSGVPTLIGCLNLPTGYWEEYSLYMLE